MTRSRSGSTFCSLWSSGLADQLLHRGVAGELRQPVGEFVPLLGRELLGGLQFLPEVVSQYVAPLRVAAGDPPRGLAESGILRVEFGRTAFASSWPSGMSDSAASTARRTRGDWCDSPFARRLDVADLDEGVGQSVVEHAVVLLVGKGGEDRGDCLRVADAAERGCCQAARVIVRVAKSRNRLVEAGKFPFQGDGEEPWERLLGGLGADSCARRLASRGRSPPSRPASRAATSGSRACTSRRYRR